MPVIVHSLRRKPWFLLLMASVLGLAIWAWGDTLLPIGSQLVPPRPPGPVSATPNESFWLKVLVPFGAALGGAAAGAVLGALLNWRFNSKLERDRRMETEAARRRALLYENASCMVDALCRVNLTLADICGHELATVEMLKDEDGLVVRAMARNDAESLIGTPAQHDTRLRSAGVHLALLELAREIRHVHEAFYEARNQATSILARSYVILEPHVKELEALLDEASSMSDASSDAADLLRGDWPGLAAPFAEAVAKVQSRSDVWSRRMGDVSEKLMRAALPSHTGDE